MKAVEKPNLPKMADTILIGEKYFELLQKPLEKLGIKALSVPDNAFVDPRLAGHADLSVLHGGGEMLWLAPHLRGSDFADQLRDMGFALDYPDISQSAAYPGDAQLNVCSCGKYAICNKFIVPTEIVNYLTSRGFEIVDCGQGYAKCSACVVDEGSIITADRGIEAAARKAGLDVLLIEPGYISLDGFTFGFIGGSSFKISRSKLAFTGTLDAHPNRDEILRFLVKHEIETVYLTEKPAFDIGSGIPLIEQSCCI